MPQEPFVSRHGSPTETVVGSHEARKYESEAVVRDPLAAIDYDREQDERWARLSPRLIEALDKLFGIASVLEPAPMPVLETTEAEHFDYEGLVGYNWFM